MSNGTNWNFMTNKKKRYVFHYTSNCIVCNNEFKGISDRKNRKTKTCTNRECIDKAMAMAKLIKCPKDEESIKQRTTITPSNERLLLERFIESIFLYINTW